MVGLFTIVLALLIVFFGIPIVLRILYWIAEFIYEVATFNSGRSVPPHPRKRA